MNNQAVKPIFKYIGGKTWLREELRQAFEIVWNNSQGLDCYVEPFCGGLGAFLGVYDLLLTKGITKVGLNDTNKKLIDFYRLVQTDPKSLIKAYSKLEQDFQQTIPAKAKELHPVVDKVKLKKLLTKANAKYVETRKEFNAGATTAGNELIWSSARLLFLQKHGFNGIYRENSKGEYNTPYGWGGKNFSLADTAQKINQLKAIFDQFNMSFSQQNVAEMIFTPNQLLYLDPPYLNETSGENKYNKIHFGRSEQLNLLNKIRGFSFVYSNHEQQILVDTLKQQPRLIEIKKIFRKNIISASVASRQQDKVEILALAGNNPKPSSISQATDKLLGK